MYLNGAFLLRWEGEGNRDDRLASTSVDLESDCESGGGCGSEVIGSSSFE